MIFIVGMLELPAGLEESNLKEPLILCLMEVEVEKVARTVIGQNRCMPYSTRDLDFSVLA